MCIEKVVRISDLISDASAIGKDKFVAEEYVFRIIESNEDILMSGRVCNKFFLMILDDISLLNSTNFFLMYLKESLEEHLPARRIKKFRETI